MVLKRSVGLLYGKTVIQQPFLCRIVFFVTEFLITDLLYLRIESGMDLNTAAVHHIVYFVFGISRCYKIIFDLFRQSIDKVCRYGRFTLNFVHCLYTRVNVIGLGFFIFSFGNITLFEHFLQYFFSFTLIGIGENDRIELVRILSDTCYNSTLSVGKIKINSCGVRVATSI